MSTQHPRIAPRFSLPAPRRAVLALGLAAAAAAATWASPALAQQVQLDTSAGPIVVQLDAAKAPKTVENFLGYVRKGHYNGTIFHRVIADFMIQGGGFEPNFQEKPTQAPIALEKTGLANTAGTLAMARTNNPNSATAQFFINVKDNAFLDPDKSPDGNGYAVFGKVIKGMDVVNKIRAVPTTRVGPYSDVPSTAVVIKSATVLK